LSYRGAGLAFFIAKIPGKVYFYYEIATLSFGGLQ